MATADKKKNLAPKTAQTKQTTNGEFHYWLWNLQQQILKLFSH